ncbi:hypothetical protein Ac2012v2_006198 [Leucoagaricus gongylophorus]
MFLPLIILGAFLIAGHLSAAAPTVNQMLGFLKNYNIDWSYPRLVDIASGVDYSALDPNVVGRVDITNTFVGSELNTEESLGSPLCVPLNQTVTELVIQGNTLSTSLIVQFNWTVAIIPLQFNVFFQFNDEGKVTQYDAQLVRSSWAFQTVLPLLVPRIASELGLPNSTDPTVIIATKAAKDICTTHEEYCIGANLQYNSTQECIDFIMNRVPFGDIWQAGQDTGICRYLHHAMVPRRPGVHCPHIGPSGGDMCIPRDYVQVTTENPFASSFIQVPGFECYMRD